MIQVENEIAPRRSDPDSGFPAQAAESRQDSLTGLGNRRAYDERLASEVAAAVRYERPLALALLDLDGFKAVNDRDGRPAGDEVLRRVGELLRRGCRGADASFRIGGDEFAILMPSTDAAKGAGVAGRVIAAVNAARVGGGAVTVSCGVAEATSGDPALLHAEADDALHVAKRTWHLRRQALMRGA